MNRSTATAVLYGFLAAFALGLVLWVSAPDDPENCVSTSGASAEFDQARRELAESMGESLPACSDSSVGTVGGALTVIGALGAIAAYVTRPSQWSEMSDDEILRLGGED